MLLLFEKAAEQYGLGTRNRKTNNKNMGNDYGNYQKPTEKYIGADLF